ncbi:MAG: DUF1329 domain-containing protein [Thermodesulfobacteriota bacterium]|nr:DUF1329 domain-containing protein [Thermodesulfobacteriota bacterium]
MKKILFFVTIFLCNPFLLLAGEIKPGVVINSENVESYLSELKKFLTPSISVSVINGLKNGWITLPIIEMHKYQLPKTYLELTAQNAGNFKVNNNNKLIGLKGKFQAGIPFPTPKDGKELAWNAYLRYHGADSRFISDFFLYNKNCKLERAARMKLYIKWWMHRGGMPPIPEMPGNNGVIKSKESIIVQEPFDVRGFVMLRIRYDDIEKDDDVYSYIPAIRRIRRLTGADLTDPMMGTDMCNDDFEGWRQKINPIMTFKILGAKAFLFPIRYKEKPPEPFSNVNCFQTDWEIRRHYILQIDTNDQNYAYNRRILYLEKEDVSFECNAAENYDQKGRLWRTCGPIVWNRKPPFYNLWFGGLYMDQVSKHSSLMILQPAYSPIPNEKFTVQGLLKEAK